MAKQDTARSGRLPAIARFDQMLAGGSKAFAIIAITIASVIILGIIYDAKLSAFMSALIISGGSFAGYFIGRVLSNGAESLLKRRKESEDINRTKRRIEALNSVDIGLQPIISPFVSVTVLVSCLYVIFYFLAIVSMSNHLKGDSNLPLDFKVLIISAATIGAFGYFSVRYAAYVKMTKRLEIALKQPPKDRNRDLIGVLRETVFRGEHLYEPAGNIFVTVGITATFVGLAVALVILDLPSLLGQAGDSSSAPITGGIDQAGLSPDQLEEHRRARAMASMTSFVGCMGLALGMSMVGVMTAMAAQWLRGLGASQCTEDLIEDADAYLGEVKPPRRKNNAGATAIPPQTPGKQDGGPVSSVGRSAPEVVGDGATAGDEPSRGGISIVKRPNAEGINHVEEE